ncbi:MAG: hypothetical protein WCT32_01755 [Patescibacteria group bacterium]|jgi:hypothetical protein
MPKRNNQSTSFAKENFYGEIDKLRLRSSCSLFSLALILGFVFILLVGCLLFVGNYVRSRSTTPSRKSGAWFDRAISVIGQKPNSDIETKQLDSNIIMITVNEAALGRVFQIDEPSFPLKRASLKVNQESIVISGRSSESIFSLKLYVGIRPTVVDGRMNFEIAEIKAGNIAAPPKIIDALRPTIEKNTKEYLPLVGSDIVVDSIRLFDGYMEIQGHKLQQS